MERARRVYFIRMEKGYYDAVTKELGEEMTVGGIWEDGQGWHAQAAQPHGVFPPYKADIFDSLKWAKEFVVNNAWLPY